MDCWKNEMDCWKNEMDCWKNMFLVHNSSIAVVSLLWYNMNPAHSYLKYNHLSSEEFDSYWEELEDTVISNIKLLEIPESTKKLLINIVQPIGKEIQNWLEFCQFLELKNIQLLHTIVWESPGLIDYKATAEKAVLNESLSVLNRFRLACINCLEVTINQLWPELRSYFYDVDNNILNYTNFKYNEVSEVRFWVYKLEDKLEEIWKISSSGCIRNAAWFAVLSNNDVAAKYFLEQLKPEDLRTEVKNSVDYLIQRPRHRNSKLWAYLFSKLSKTDQNILFVEKTACVLRKFLNWPLQFLFLKLIDDLWNVMSPEAYYSILEEVIVKASEFHHGHIYKEAFKELWKKASLRYKCFIIDQCINFPFLCRLSKFSIKAHEFTEQIIKYATADQRLQMLTKSNGRNTIDLLIREKRWQTLTFYIEVCISNESDIQQLREVYSKHVKAKRCYKPIDDSYLLYVGSDTDIERFNTILDILTIFVSHMQK